MSVQAGTYRASFMTPLGAGTGVIVIQEGKARGGDSAMMYVGTYEEDDSSISAILTVTRHSNTPGIQSVFGVDNITAQFRGQVNSSLIELRGSSPQAPGIEMRATLTRLAD